LLAANRFGPPAARRCADARFFHGSDNRQNRPTESSGLLKAPH